MITIVVGLVISQEFDEGVDSVRQDSMRRSQLRTMYNHVHISLRFRIVYRFEAMIF